MSRDDSIKANMANMPPFSGEEARLEPKKPSSNNCISGVLLHNHRCKLGGNQREYYKEAVLKWEEKPLDNWMIG